MTLMWLLSLCGTLAMALGFPYNCGNLCPSHDIDIEQVVGEWHMLMGFSSAYTTTAFCWSLEVTLEGEHLWLNWSTPSQIEPEFNCSLDVLQPGLWKQTSPGTTVVKVLDLVPGYYMILAFCEQDSNFYLSDNYTVLVLIKQEILTWEQVHALRTQVMTQEGVAQTNSGYICFSTVDFGTL